MILTKIRQFLTFKRCAALLVLFLLVFMNATGSLHAQTVGYGADEVLQRGLIVGTKQDDPTRVEAINVDQIDRILGVVVNANESPITISSEDEQVFVSTSGQVEVLVSDQNGSIKSGDYITVSSLNGIGMLATFNESHIVGRAIEGFDGRNSVISTAELTDTHGNKRPVNIGRIKILIDVSSNPMAKSAAVTPEWLGRIGQAIAGKSLSPARIYISAAIFIVGSFIAGAILYAGIRSSIIAIGRNPLSKKSILRGLLQVVFTSLIVFIISVVGVYLLLRA